MSFILPGNARSLRFTGEAKAYVSGGKPRVRKQSSPPSPPRVPNPSHITTPSPGVNPSARIVTPTPSPVVTSRPMRPPIESISDDPTTAMDRDDVLPGAIRTPKPAVAPHAPAIPHFRPRVVEPVAAPSPTPNTGSRDVKVASAPYAIWVLASIIAGLVSYHLAPEILVRLDPPAHTTGNH
jgi:hypothetical protein